MNSVSVVLLLSTLANTLLVAYVFWRRHHRPVHFAFFYMVLACAVWNFANFTVSFADDLTVTRVAGRAAFALGVAVAFACLHFSWYFPETHHIRPTRRTVVVAALTSSVMFLLACSPLVQRTVMLGPHGKQPVFGPAHPPYVIYMVVVFFAAFWNLFRTRLKTPSGRARMQLNYCLTGLVLSFIPAYIANFVLPFVTPRAEYYLLGAASPLVWTLFTFYAISRYRLMDIGLAFRNVLIYGMMAVILTSLFQIPFALHSRAIAGMSTTATTLLSILLTVLLALTVAPLQRRVAAFVDQHLFRGRYDHEAALVRFGGDLVRTYGRENIAARVAEQIPIIMQADGGSVYLPDEHSDSYALVSWSGPEDLRRPLALAQGCPLVGEVRRRMASVLRDEIAYARHRRSTDAAVLDVLEAAAAEVALPLVVRDSLLGVVLLAGRKNDHIYTTDDLKLLGALGSQAAIALDNTRLYEEIVASQKHYETILRHMQRGVLTVDPSLRITTLNEAGAAMLRTEADQCQGRAIGELVPEFQPLLARTLRDQRDQAVLDVTVHMGEKELPFGCETSLLQDSHNRTTGALIVFEDLFERKRFEQQVRRMDRLASIGTLAAGMAHEIKNPLVSIQTFAQLLPERHEDEDFRDNFGRVVVDEVSRINAIVQNLLDFARPRPYKPGRVELHGVLRRTLTLVGNTIRKKQVELDYQPADAPVTVNGDSEQLHQVFLNLLQNALDAVEDPPRSIAVSAEVRPAHPESGRGHDVVVRVADTGKGVPADRLPHIFDPFFSTKEHGHGLGLAICHGILQEHGAEIEVDSEIGRGTAFTVRFPACLDDDTDRPMEGDRCRES